MLLTVNKLNKETITGVVGNDKYRIPYDEETYNELLELELLFEKAESVEEATAIIVYAMALTLQTTETVIASECPHLKYDSNNGNFYLHQNGQTSSIPVPKALANKIVESVEKDLPFEPLVKAWIWFLRNPKFTLDKAHLFANYLLTTVVDDKEALKLQIEEGLSTEKANELATYNDIGITKNGLLVTYKYAQIQSDHDYTVEYSEDGEAKVNLKAEEYQLIPPVMRTSGDAFYANELLGHNIKVGAIHRLPDWSYVNTNDQQSCVKGLHLGGLRYIKGYGGSGNLLLNCFVNPMHIGAFDHDGRGAIRVLEYFVHSAQFAPNKQMYHESNYLSHTETEWAIMREEAIKKSEETIAKLKNYQEQINAF
jgi:hypothetical protein